MNELFPSLEPVLSPRLRWMAENNIRVNDNGQNYEEGDESPETGEQLYRFCATRGDTFAGLHCEHSTGWGNTEDDALVALAKKLGIPLWNEGGLK